jgi:xanthine dehydrogenase iron-sulfur cluster and FAD-binding subunit A
VLLHRPLDDAALREAGAALRLSPLSDHRAGATYRLDAARGLLRRLALRHAGLAATVHEA